MTETPTVTPEEMIAAIDVKINSHEGVLRGWLPEEQRAAFNREMAVLTAARDFIKARAAQDAAVAKSVEEEFGEFRKDHFHAAHPVSEACLTIAFADGCRTGRRLSMADVLTVAGQGFAAKDAEIDALKQRIGELGRELHESAGAIEGLMTSPDAQRVAELTRENAELRLRLGNCVWRYDAGRVCGLPRASHGLGSGLHGYTAPDPQPTPDTDGPEAFSRALMAQTKEPNNA